MESIFLAICLLPGSTLTGKNMGVNSFFYEMTPFYMGGNNENDSAASHESVPNHLK